jgi:dephospho-CoA kinase
VSDKPVIGLTGGIASGKSVVADVLRAEGIAVIDADALAREVVAPGSDGLREVVAAFGSAVLDTGGGLDRESLGRVVFADSAARKRLEAITHPRIGRLSMERLAHAAAGPSPYVVYEAPLLVETGAHRGLAGLVVVSAREATQVARVRTRDALDEAAARARIAAQLPLADKVAVADWVIDNDESLEALRARALDVHRAILARFGHG